MPDDQLLNLLTGWIVAMAIAFAGIGTWFALHLKQREGSFEAERNATQVAHAKERESANIRFINTLDKIVERCESNKDELLVQLAQVNVALASLMEYNRNRPHNQRQGDPRP